jgi:hypothetical protein
MVASDRSLSTMSINDGEVMDLSFLKQLAEERKAKDSLINLNAEI